MIRKWDSRNKNSLQQRIANYTKRRIEGKQKGKKTGKLSVKIYDLKRSLCNLEQNEAKVKEIAALVEEFTGLDVKGQHSNRKHSYVLAKNLFYKIGVETGKTITTYLIAYTGDKNWRIPARQRMRFTKSFVKNKKNLETWNRFKQFMKEKEHEIQNPT